MDAGYLSAVCDALGVAPADVVAAQWVDNGPGWVGLLLADAAAVLSLRPQASPLSTTARVGVVGPHPPRSECQFEVRAFNPGPGTFGEDPVTGSLNAGLGQWLIRSGLAPTSYVAAQGSAVGRDGRVHIHADGDDVWVSGRTDAAVRGTVDIHPD